MSENTGFLTEIKGKPVPPILYALISNVLQVYGILILGWHFFPLLYLWWWEELVLSIFGVLKLRRLRPFLLQKQGETARDEGERSAKARFFLLFVYFVFVVVLAGFMFAPEESFIPNVLTLIWKNKVFNINLLLFVGMQGWIFWRDFYREPAFEKTDFLALQTTFDLRSAIIHVGLLAGAFLSFLLPKFSLSGSEHTFMFGFMAVKTLVEQRMAFKTKEV